MGRRINIMHASTTVGRILLILSLVLRHGLTSTTTVAQTTQGPTTHAPTTVMPTISNASTLAPKTTTTLPPPTIGPSFGICDSINAAACKLPNSSVVDLRALCDLLGRSVGGCESRKSEVGRRKMVVKTHGYNRVGFVCLFVCLFV